MISKTMFMAALVSIISLCSCAKDKVKTDDHFFGEWQMLDDPSKAKRIILEPNGEAKFIEVDIQDLGREEKGSLPELGKWKLNANGDQIEFSFAFGGGDYGELAQVVSKKEGLELRFAVGDPDDFAWKRFRLVKPNVD
jgi:hypothetical protein